MSLAELFRPHRSRFDLSAACRVCALSLFALGSVAGWQTQVSAQTPSTASAKPVPDSKASGDAPDDPGPLATDISSELKPQAIQAVVKKVAAWQVKVAEPTFNRLWTYAALYDGLLAASKATGDPAFRDAVLKFSEEEKWQLIDNRFPHADDEAMGKAYMDLYLGDSKNARKPERMANTKEIMDRLVVRPDEPKLLWWWCDALYMAPPVLSRMYLATGDKKYLDYMDHEWWLTSKTLYNQQDHLYFRDERYLTQKQANGKNLYWSRGNGWVMGGLVKVLEIMPKNYPTRAKYVEQFKQMAEEVKSIQSKDGLWRSGLLDPDAYDLPEISGSAFFTYAIAYGINEHILDRKTYLPVVEKSWAGMLKHVYADGRLGSIQPVDGQPGRFKPSSSHVYGVGGFLMAGYEMNRLAGGKR
ncbi:glycoside hydrolase family 88/105 protein [Edaphobacter albus]|uniref:glycoside hydrolase family 88/105 protein n=1 Tax=Edaphobacter sp. 4G125 TaxID=2763071 RepID=UPI001645A0B8|nr:glycoside hydrolase family 88 protein [Edaphobacter sp. 4G125]QNI38232.1 glycoside hydrolase family 88 protein [Edaphobacter sp. 4G125]